MKIKTAALIGLGAIGSFIAGNLADVLGDNLRVIASGERAGKLREEGRIINGKQQFFLITDPEEETGPADLAVVITKMPQLKEALEQMKNQIGPETVIMTPLNGVDSENAAIEAYGSERVIYSLARISAVKDGNRISFNPERSFLEFGEKYSETPSERVLAVKELFESAGIGCILKNDMIRAIWEKFVCNVSENPVAAVLGIPFGAWGASEHANFLRVKTGEEVIKIAHAKGIWIDDDYCKEHVEILKKQPYANKASTLQDIENGRHTEIEMFSGTIMRLGKELGIETPYSEFLYHAVRVLEEKNDGLI